MNDHLRSGKSSSSTDNVDMNVDMNVDVGGEVDADAGAGAGAAKVVEAVEAVGDPSIGNEVTK